MKDTGMKKIILLLLLGISSAITADEAKIGHNISSKVKPWTDKPLLDSGDKFHFAIFSDNTGESREGVFAEAVEKVNLLQPAFAICVGDLIQGYKNGPDKISAEWDEFNRILNKLDMRFYYVPGNHDIIRHAYPNLYKEWIRRFGASYYSFVYKDVMFLILHTQETGPAGLGTKQIEWALNVIRNSKEREIFVFLHQPLWIKTKRYEKSGFKEIMEALKNRRHTVFAGHYHSYAWYSINQQKYIRLSVTGGIKWEKYNVFDHIMWVTVRKNKRPVIACLKLDGIERDDAINDSLGSLIKTMKVARLTTSKYSLTISNPLQQAVSYNIDINSLGTAWMFDKEDFKGKLNPGQKIEISGVLSGNRYPAPTTQGFFVIDGKKCKFKLTQGIFLQVTREHLTYKSTNEKNVIDGKLDEPVWQTAPTLSHFINKSTFRRDKTGTKAWITGDRDNLYIAVKCPEPDMSKIVAGKKGRDANIWWEDNVEIFIDANLDHKTYFQFAVNPNNAIYDGNNQRRKKFNANIISAVLKNADNWVWEIAIPWKDLNVKNPPAKKLGILFCRNRPGREKITQAPVTGSDNHHVPQLFSDIKLSQIE